MEHNCEFDNYDKKKEKELIFNSATNTYTNNLFIKYIQWKLNKTEHSNYPIINLLMGYNSVVNNEGDDVINEVMEMEYGEKFHKTVMSIKKYETLIYGIIMLINIFRLLKDI
jgi:hypothetical protein